MVNRAWALLRRDLGGLLDALPHRNAGPRPGLYTYRLRPPGGSRRVHLRVAADGSATLLVDVTDAVHLNATAALLAWSALEGEPPQRAGRRLARRFRVAAAERDRAVAEVYAIVDHLATCGEGCPTCGLAQLERTPLFSTPVDAPYKADLALSYRCNNACGHCYNPPQRRAMRSLDTGGWRRVLGKLAAVGVPHVIFTGGEPTLLENLPELVRAAERLGLVTGINTNGRRLGQPGCAAALARAGANHVQITLESCRKEVHDAMTGAEAFEETVRGIAAAQEAGLYVLTNTTLTRRNVDHVEQIVEFLHHLGLRTMAANGMIHAGAGRNHADALAEEELGPVLVRLRDCAAELGMRLLWYTPTAYCRLSPVELELGPRRCNAGQYSICVEPNGDVLPCQSDYRPVGNLLRDPWPAIWNDAGLVRFRNRTSDPRGAGLPRECWDCPELPLCGGGCPLVRRAGASSVNDHAGCGEKGDKSNLCEAPCGPLRGKLDLSPFSPACRQDRLHQVPD